MVILMRKDMQEICILHIHIDSAVGNGILYVTDHAIACEVTRRGLYLHFVPRSSIKRLDVTKSSVFGARRCRLVWLEDDTEYSLKIGLSNI